MRIYKKLLIVFISFVFLSALIWLNQDRLYSKDWKINDDGKNRDDVAWSSFYWAGDSLSDKIAMFIPVRFEKIPYNFSLQFDTGIPFTEIYQNNLDTLVHLFPFLIDKVKRDKRWFVFWYNKKHIEDLALYFEHQTLSGGTLSIHRNFGDKITAEELKTGKSNIGSLGCDILRNKVLIIDYPHLRLSLTDSVPVIFKGNMHDFTLTADGRILLPMKIGNKDFKVLFDNGSSMFQLITSGEGLKEFSTSKPVDTIRISSWGKTNPMPGRIISDSIYLAGRYFKNVKIYTNEAQGVSFTSNGFDAITGNALFWDNILVIDLRNRKFGLY